MGTRQGEELVVLCVPRGRWASSGKCYREHFKDFQDAQGWVLPQFLHNLASGFFP